MIDRKRAEDYIFLFLVISTVAIFLLTPAHAADNFDYALNYYVDKYLLGNGYYSPSEYPFAAKVTNSFSVVSAVLAGVFVGIWRRNDVERVPKYAWWWCLICLGLAGAMFLLSVYPQKFSVSTGSTFGSSEAFHNNPVLFLLMMMTKQICIYVGLRAPLAFFLFAVGYARK